MYFASYSTCLVYFYSNSRMFPAFPFEFVALYCSKAHLPVSYATYRASRKDGNIGTLNCQPSEFKVNFEKDHFQKSFCLLLSFSSPNQYTYWSYMLLIPERKCGVDIKTKVKKAELLNFFLFTGFHLFFQKGHQTL